MSVVDTVSQSVVVVADKVTTDGVMLTVLAFVVFVIVSGLVKKHRAREAVNFFDLLMHGGKLSHAYVFATGGWLLHSCAVLLWTIHGTVKSDDFLIYAGIWVTPILAYIIKGKPVPLPEEKKDE